MTEAEWPTCLDAERLFTFLQGKVSERKLRLFLVACCRRIIHLMTDLRGLRAIEVAEKYADGHATRRELATARKWVRKATRSVQLPHRNQYRAAEYTASELSPPQIAACLRDAAHATAPGPGNEPGRASERVTQATILGDVVGNPFRPPRRLDPALLAWNGGTVVKIAQGIYEERAFDRMPILADALEDAGCDDADLLAHCREPGDHVCGCWALDLLLGKE